VRLQRIRNPGRTVERVAAEAALSEEQAADLLRSDGAVRFRSGSRALLLAKDSPPIGTRSSLVAGAAHFAKETGGTPGDKEGGKLSKDEYLSRWRPCLRGTAATGVFCTGCVENEGLVLAPQVGLEPTILRLTAEPLIAASGCKHKYLNARCAEFHWNWGGSGGTPNGSECAVIEPRWSTSQQRLYVHVPAYDAGGSKYQRLAAAASPAGAEGATVERDQSRGRVPALRPEREMNRDLASDIGQQVEVFVVLVLTTFPVAQQLLRFDELDTLDPFDHLVAKLVLDSQPQRRAID